MTPRGGGCRYKGTWSTGIRTCIPLQAPSPGSSSSLVQSSSGIALRFVLWRLSGLGGLPNQARHGAAQSAVSRQRERLAARLGLLGTVVLVTGLRVRVF